MKLDLESLDSAIGALEILSRKKQNLEDPDFVQASMEFGIRADVLKERFWKKHPSGSVPAPLPTERENHERRIAQLVSLEKEQMHKFGFPFDGREVVLGGILHTVIRLNNSTRRVYAINHDKEETASYSFAEIRRLSAEREPS